MINRIIKVVLLKGLLLLVLLSICGCNTYFPILESGNSFNQGVNFDLSQYKDHGNLSCGLIWATQYHWSDVLDGDYEMFAYFDIDGNQKSSWFNKEEYFESDFYNDFVIIEKVKKVDNERWHDKKFEVYNKSFDLIASLDCDIGGISRFNEFGYAFATDISSFYYIDANGAHKFDEHVLFYDVNDIETTEKYFNVEGNYLCDHQGKILVNVRKTIEEYIDSTGNYSRESFSKDYYITLSNIIDNESIDVTFNAKNTKSKNMVEFTCKIGFNGEFIEHPTKASGEDIDIVSENDFF